MCSNDTQFLNSSGKTVFIAQALCKQFNSLHLKPHGSTNGYILHTWKLFTPSVFQTVKKTCLRVARIGKAAKLQEEECVKTQFLIHSYI